MAAYPLFLFAPQGGVEAVESIVSPDDMLALDCAAVFDAPYAGEV